MTSSLSNSKLDQEVALQFTRPPWTTPKTSPGPSKFSALPLELRNMIWDWYLAHSRVVWIRWDPETKTHTGHDMEHPHCHVPSILQINRESRSYGLRYYSRAFAPSPDQSRCYFNYNLDWAYFNPAERYYDIKGIPRPINNSGFHDITRLYLEEFNFWGPLQRRHFEDLNAFSKLDTIFIYNRDHGSAKFIPNCVFPTRDGAVEHLLIRVLEGMHSELLTQGEGSNRWPELLCSGGEKCSLHYWYRIWNTIASIGCYHRRWTPILDLFVNLTFASSPYPRFLFDTRVAKEVLEKLWPEST